MTLEVCLFRVTWVDYHLLTIWGNRQLYPVHYSRCKRFSIWVRYDKKSLSVEVCINLNQSLVYDFGHSFFVPAATIGAIVGGAAAGVVSSGKEKGDPRILPVADIGDACIVIRPIWTKGKRELGYPYHKSHVSTNAIIAIDYLFRFGIHCWCSFTSPGQVICSITPWSFGGWHWCRYGFHVGTRLYQ